MYLSGTLSLIRVSNDLDPDQDRRSVGAKLGPEFAKVISRQQKSPLAGKRLMSVLCKTNQVQCLILTPF